MSNGNVIPFQPGVPTQQGNWMWDGSQWTCGPCGPPPFPNCPPPGFPPAGCPPWFSGPNSPPWYPGANAGVSFGTTAPMNPVRGHFWWDGKSLWIFDGAAWDNVAATSPGLIPAPADGFAYGQVNNAWARVLALTGGTLTGPLILAADPTTVLGAVTKQYADAHSGVQALQPTYYTTSQTITIPAGSHQGLVQMWGASGGSGGVSANGVSGGVGAGGYLEKLLTGLVPGNTIIFTQGAAGTAGTATPTNGGNGGTTTLASGSQSIGTLTCNGSAGSLGVTNTASPGTLGGTATGGDINLTGQPGYQTSGGASVSTPGGGSTFFAQGPTGAVATGPGTQGNPGGLKITWAIFSS